MTVFLVGIAGGSGSGKTTLANAVVAALPPGGAAVLPADAYYRSLDHLAPALRARQNFDEPAALDEERLVADVTDLRAEKPVLRPCYDFVGHTRSLGTVPVEAAPVVLVEGIFVLALPAVRALLDLRVFVDAPEPLRRQRRLVRDCRERGRSPLAAEAQYAATTLPMHDRHVEPCRALSDLVVAGDGDLGQAVAAILGRVGRSIGL